MSVQRYYVVGGEYADTSFTTPAPGTELETRGPFTEREAKICWRDLTGRTVDNAMVRYFLRAEEEVDKSKTYWVVGGEYADFGFTKMQTGKELEVYGPFDKWDAALGFWRGMTAKSVDDALVRYDIRENYQPGDSPVGKRPAAIAKFKLAPAQTKSIAIAAAPEKVFAFLMDGNNWPKWAIHNVKGVTPRAGGIWNIQTAKGNGQLTLKGDAASGVLDEVFVDADGNAWNVPGRVVAAAGATVVMMTFTKPAGVNDAQFVLGMAQMDDELETLKRVMEGG